MSPATARAASRRVSTMAVLLLLLVGLLPGFALAQENDEPYPPPPPPPPGPEIECELFVRGNVRVAECRGRRLKPNSAITIEVRVRASAQAAQPAVAATVLLAQEDELVASGEGTTNPAGMGTARTEFGCDVEGIATIRGEGEAPDDPAGDPSVVTEIERDLADFECPAAAARPISRLPFTGQDLLLLLLIAALLLLAGYGLLRSRPRRPA